MRGALGAGLESPGSAGTWGLRRRAGPPREAEPSRLHNCLAFRRLASGAVAAAGVWNGGERGGEKEKEATEPARRFPISLSLVGLPAYAVGPCSGLPSRPPPPSLGLLS